MIRTSTRYEIFYTEIGTFCENFDFAFLAPNGLITFIVSARGSGYYSYNKQERNIKIRIKNQNTKIKVKKK